MKNKVSKLKKALWRVFSKYIRQRDGGKCFTCQKDGFTGRNYHAGHFLPKRVAGVELYFSEKFVNGQCASCNLSWQAHQYLYGKRLGKKLVAEAFSLIGKVEWSEEKYLEKINYYKCKLKK